MTDVIRPLRERLVPLEDDDAAAARGRALRKAAPRSSLARLVPSARTATEILVEQNHDRLADLVPLRFARMLMDPFSFYRGSAAVMAADLAVSPSSGVEVMCGGDAHISNFGVYASPQRSLLFDLNDFDETAVAPAEWDIKRLVTSAIVGGRQAGYPEKAIRRIAVDAMQGYRRGLRTMLKMSVLDRYYLRMEPQNYAEQVSGEDLAATIKKVTKAARTRTSARVFARIMEQGPDGRMKLRQSPPVLQHIDVDDEMMLIEAFREYLTSVPADVAMLLSQFRLTDIARRVVGVGSVGSRCYLLILTASDGTPLILQVKQANPSVLQAYGQRRQPESLVGVIAALGQGSRVVAGQRILQAMSDVFLGTLRINGRDYYVRQFQDMKGSVDLVGMSPQAFGEYVVACALSLARAHAQSLAAPVLYGYVGDGETVSRAVVEWSYAYADKALDDFHQLRDAAKAGQIEVAADPLR